MPAPILTPVDYDPFAATPSDGPSLTPVDYDPFAPEPAGPPDFSAVQGSAVTMSEDDMLTARLRAKLPERPWWAPSPPTYAQPQRVLADDERYMGGSEVPRFNAAGDLGAQPTNRDVQALQQSVIQRAGPAPVVDPFLAHRETAAPSVLQDRSSLDRFGGLMGTPDYQGGLPTSPVMGSVADFDARFGRGAAEQYIGMDATPQQRMPWWREQLGAMGEQRYGQGAGYLIDNPLTRGLGQAARTTDTGLAYLARKGTDAMGWQAGSDFLTGEMAANAEAMQGLVAPKDAGLGSAAVQALGNLGGQLTFGAMAGAGGVPVRGAMAAERVGLMGAARAAAVNPATRMAGTLGVTQAGSEAADIEASTGRPLSAGQFGTMALTDTAANLVPLAGRWNMPARVGSGAAVGFASNEASNLAGGREAGTGALMATTFGGALGVMPGHYSPTLADEGRALAQRVAFGNRVDFLRDATARQDLDERLAATARANNGMVHPDMLAKLADQVAGEHNISIDTLLRAPRNPMDAGAAAADAMLGDMRRTLTLTPAPPGTTREQAIAAQRAEQQAVATTGAQPEPTATTTINQDALANLAPREPALPEVHPGVSRDELVQRWNAAQTDVEKATAAASIRAFDVRAQKQGADAPAPAVEDGSLDQVGTPPGEMVKSVDDLDAPNFGVPEPARTLPDDHPLLRSRDQDASPERVAMRHTLVEQRFAGKQPVPEGGRPIALVMGGGGASGKGTLLKRLRAEGQVPEGAVELDPDSFKTGDAKKGLQGIPEYSDIVNAGDSRAAGITHEESSSLYKQALGRAIDGRYNLVLDRTMSDASKGLREIQALKDAGYEVHLVGVTVEPGEAVRRAVSRAAGPEKRYVPLSALLTAHKGFSNAFGQYVPLVDRATLFDNNVTRGADPVEIARSEGGSPLEVVDQQRYNDFVGKGGLNERATTHRSLDERAALEAPQRSGSANAPADRLQAGRHGEGDRGTRSRPATAEPVPATNDLTQTPPEGGVPVSGADSDAPTASPSTDNGPTNSLSRTASWVIRDKATGKPVMETFEQRVVDMLDTAKYEAVPVAQHLGDINRTLHGEGGVPEPVADQAALRSDAAEPAQRDGIQPQTEQPKFSRDDAGRAPHTADQVRESARKGWGNRFITKLERAGVLHFVTADEAVARGLAKSADELSGVKGLYQDGKAYVLTDQVRDLADVPGIVVHEAGLHYGYDRLTKPDERQALRNRVNRALAAGDPDIVKAWRHAEDVGTPARALHEETMAYLVENAPGHDIVTRVVDAVKHGLNRAGVPLDTLESHTDAIKRTARDMLRKAANPEAHAGAQRVDAGGSQSWRASSIEGAPVFSRYAKAKDADYLAAVERGDMDAAQRMVNEAAREAGYDGGSAYRMQHDAPNHADNVSLADVRDSGLVPDDYWTHPHFYQADGHERQAFGVVSASLRRMDARRGSGKNPGLTSMTVYRAVPKGVKEGAIRNGDWVTPLRAYAQDEGASIPGGYRIISAQAALKNLWWDGNSIAEFGYDNGQGYGYKNTKNSRKLLDAVTRDDDGAVIPLSKRFNPRSDDTRFSRYANDDKRPTRNIHDDDPVTAGWGLIAQRDESFQLPTSKADTVKSVFKDVAPELKVEASPELAAQNEEGARQAWRITMPEGSKGVIYQNKDAVWIDVSDLEKGKGGRTVYSAVANYAHNSGKVFIGDPAGLSDVAMKRRTEQMLSSALKFGTTRHLEPHERQLMGDKRLGIEPLRWKTGDDAHNLRELARTAAENTRFEFPEIRDMSYNFETGRFERPDGSEVTRHDFERIARERRTEGERAARLGHAPERALRAQFTAGRASLERAVVTHALSRLPRGEGPELLARLGQQQPAGSRLDKVLYSRDTPQQVRQQADIARQSVLSQLAAQGYGQGALGWTGNPNEYAGWRGKLTRGFMDKMDPVKRVERAIEDATGHTLADDADAYRLENLMHGRAADRLDAIDRNHIQPLLKSMKQQGIKPDLLMDYLYARHAPERNARVASINKSMPDSGSGMSTQLANDILAGNADGVYSGQRITTENLPKLERLAKRVDDLRNHTLSVMEASGQITPVLAAGLRTQWQYYVPLRGKEGEADTGPRGAGRGVDIKGKPIKRALGRGDGNVAPPNILAEIAGDAQRAAIQAEKARVGRAVLKLAAEHPNPDVWQVAPVDLEWKFNESTGEAYLATRKPNNDKDVLTVVHDGTPYHVRLVDPRIRDAVLNLGAEKAMWVVQTLGKFNRWLSAVNTRYNPGFVPVNMVRDAMVGFTGMAAEHGVGVARDARKLYGKAMAASWRDASRAPGDASVPDAHKTMDDWAREYAENGGKTGIVHFNDVELTTRRLEDSFKSAMELMGELRPLAAAGKGLEKFRPIVRAVELANDATENAMRLAAYTALRKRGMSGEKAAAYAKDLTVNFNRKGQLGGLMNSLYLFYNASIQGVRRGLQLMKNPKSAAFVGGLAALQAQQTALLMSRQDDDGVSDWDSIPFWKKMRSLIIALPGKGNYFALPMPYEFGWFVYAGGRLTEFGMGGDPSKQGNVINDLGAAALQSFSPVPLDSGFPGLMPELGKIGLNLSSNKNDFGSRITNEKAFSKYEGPRSTLGRSGTAAPYVWLSKALNRVGGGDDYHAPEVAGSLLDWSPEDLQYISNTMLGGLGSFTSGSFVSLQKLLAGNYRENKDGSVDVNWPALLREFPILKTAGWSVDTNRARSDRFYDIRSEIERTKAMVQNKLDHGDMAGAMAAAKKAGVFADGMVIKTNQDGEPTMRLKKVDNEMVRTYQIGAQPGSLFAGYKEASSGLSWTPDGARYSEKVQEGVSDYNRQIQHAYTLPAGQRERAIKELQDQRGGLMGSFLRLYEQRKGIYAPPSK